MGEESQAGKGYASERARGKHKSIAVLGKAGCVVLWKRCFPSRLGWPLEMERSGLDLFFSSLYPSFVSFQKQQLDSEWKVCLV